MRILIILPFLLLQGSLSFASFEANSRRYMSYYDLLNSMKVIFFGDKAVSAGEISGDCIAVTENNRADLGYNNPSTGEAANSSPNSSYVRWIGSCVSSYMLRISQQDLATNLLLSEKTKEYLNKLANTGGWSAPIIFNRFQVVDFNSLPEDIRLDMVEHAFYVIFGAEESFNQFKLMDAKVYKATVKDHLEKHNYNVYKALEVIMLNYLMRDEFLSY